MSRNALHQTNIVHLNLTSASDRSHLSDLLSGVRPGTPIRLTIGGDMANAPARRHTAAPASYADAMRVVEAIYYDAV